MQSVKQGSLREWNLGLPTSWFNSSPRHYAFATIDKTLYDNFNHFICLVASNKQQINSKIKKSAGKVGNR